MVFAGEATPTQAVILGGIWVGWFAVHAIWPRRALVLIGRYRRWQRSFDSYDDWPVPAVRETPQEPTQRAIVALRISSLVFVAIGLYLTAQGIGRM